MPTFETPEPISAVVEIGIGDITFEAGDRADTVVEVAPGDPAKQADVRAAEQTRIEFADGQLLVKAPRNWRQYAFWGNRESVDVRIELPAGSQARVEAGVAGVRSQGRLGECRVSTGVGEVQLDQAGPAQLKTGAGDITARRVTGRCEITTGTGAIRVGHIDGDAVVKNSNGDTSVGAITGDLRASSANGTITVDQADGSVAAKTARGDVRLGEVRRGSVEAQTGFGQIDVAIAAGVAAWLDLDASFGEVRNSLDAAREPEPGEDSVEVRACSSFGNIDIRRSVSLAGHPAAEPS
jgi:DUF4097 and DUF4098 domain-containing protein YvlB